MYVLYPARLNAFPMKMLKIKDTQKIKSHLTFLVLGPRNVDVGTAPLVLPTGPGFCVSPSDVFVHRSDVQQDGGHDELLHSAGTPGAAAGVHGSERLQHRPLPTGAHPATDARRPHEPIW